jgi:hypothetical protein
MHFGVLSVMSASTFVAWAGVQDREGGWGINASSPAVKNDGEIMRDLFRSARGSYLLVSGRS